MSKLPSLELLDTRKAHILDLVARKLSLIDMICMDWADNGLIGGAEIVEIGQIRDDLMKELQSFIQDL